MYMFTVPTIKLILKGKQGNPELYILYKWKIFPTKYNIYYIDSLHSYEK